MKLRHTLALTLLMTAFATPSVIAEEISIEGLTKEYAPDDVGLIGFDAAMHDFGEVEQGAVLDHVYFFLNNGLGEFSIERAFSTTSGVSVSTSSDSVEPDEIGQVKVSFNTEGLEGPQFVRIKVLSDAYNGPSMLYLKANVVPAS